MKKYLYLLSLSLGFIQALQASIPAAVINNLNVYQAQYNYCLAQTPSTISNAALSLALMDYFNVIKVALKTYPTQANSFSIYVKDLPISMQKQIETSLMQPVLNNLARLQTLYSQLSTTVGNQENANDALQALIAAVNSAIKNYPQYPQYAAQFKTYMPIQFYIQPILKNLKQLQTIYKTFLSDGSTQYRAEDIANARNALITAIKSAIQSYPQYATLFESFQP